jgi:localization factor PodJL
MTSSAPWSVKGIDPKAREAAKDLARRSGLTLGEWLNQRIQEGGVDLQEGANSVADSLEELTDRIEAAEQRSTLAVTGIDQSLRGVLARLELSEREQTAVGARFEGALQEAATVQAAIDARLRKLESEAAGPRSAEAMKSLETALGRVANHLYDGESRTRESLGDVRRDMAGLTARLEAAEKAGANRGEEVAARLVERLDEAQTRMDATVRSLQSSLAEIETRLASAETRIGDRSLSAEDVDRKLEDMAASVAQGLQAAKAEMTKQLREAIDGGAERMEQALLDMTAHVQAAERRSAEALERMGQEVLRVADTLNRRVQGIETRSAGAIQQVGGEVARVMDTLETRVARSETIQTESLEKLSGEITRVTERLADRIGMAERRAAQSVDDVGEQVNRISERLTARYDSSTSDLAERIRLSEERTHRMLEEARERIDRRLAEAAAKAPKVAPSIAEPPPFTAPSPYAEPASFADGLGPAAYSQAETAAQTPVIYPDVAPFGQAFAPADFTPVGQAFDAQDLDAAQDFATPAEAQSEADFAEDAFIETVQATHEDDDDGLVLDDEELLDLSSVDDDLYEDEPAAEALLMPAETAPNPFAPPPAATASEEIAPRILTTRELIDQARAAARAASSEAKVKKAKTAQGNKAENAGKAKARTDTSGFGLRRSKVSQGQVAMFSVLAGASVMLGTAGYLLYQGSSSGRYVRGSSPFDGVAENIDVVNRAAVALDPKPIDGVAALPAPEPAVPLGEEAENAASLYRDGRAKVEAKDGSGLELVRKAANLGYPQAQFYIGRLYEEGAAGLAKNPAEARRWYERAANAGDRGAMHNIGLMYFEGVGGAKNLTSAAQWFRKAANLGLVDSQFNMGQLYEQGLGVTQNSAEAYKWYLLASRAGTPEQRAQARDAATRLKVTLPADARMTAERIASDLAQKSSGAPVQVAAAGVDVVGVQRALARLGYFKGEANGASSQQLRVAIQSYQRDQGLSPSGTLDSATLVRITPYMR